MIPLDQALNIIASKVISSAFPQEKLSTEDALGRVLAESRSSRLDLPPFRKAMMDGYAILEEDESESFKVLETVAAGSTVQQELKPGETIKIMTGAPLPDGVGRVIPWENVKLEGDKITILKFSQAKNIAEKGEDLRKGELVIPAGTRLGALEVANLIAAGITEVAVFRRLKVAIISTGDELVEKYEDLVPGKIMNSNAPLLRSLCKLWGLEVIANLAVKDNCESLVEELKKLKNADFILLSGGVSAGDFDFVAKSLRLADFTIHFDRVAIKPGKPMTFASRDKQYIFALPGNPVAVYLTFHLFVLFAYQKLLNLKPLLTNVHLPLAKDWKRKNSERLEFVPARLQEDGTLLPIEIHGSADLMALLQCDGFFVVDVGRKEIVSGTNVETRFIASSKVGIAT
ncbi:MAG: molybdopterin molybdotransferase MoeA [Gammaproteobacteria bacterium]